GLVEFLERKLTEAGATAKVVPPPEFLEGHSEKVYADAMQSWVQENGARLIRFDRIADSIAGQFERDIRAVLRDRVAAVFAEDPTKSWREVVNDDIVVGSRKH